MPRFLSPSQVADWEECPQKWALLNVERKPGAPNKHFIHGDGVHLMLQAAGQDYLDGAPERSAEELFEVYRSAVEKRLAKDDPTFAIPREQMAAFEVEARAILKAFVAEIRPHYRPMSCEETLGEEVGLAIEGASDYFLRGRIDARVRTGRGYAVVDWKTGQPWPPDEEKAKPQGLAYLLAEFLRWQVVEHDEGALPPAVVVLFICLPVVDGVCVPEFRPVTHPHSRLHAYAEHLKHVAVAIEDARTSGVFPASVGSRCARCSVLAHCAFGSDHVRKKRLPVMTPGVRLG